MDRDRFFAAQEALEYGLVDGVIESHQLARAPLGVQRSSGPRGRRSVGGRLTRAAAEV